MKINEEDVKQAKKQAVVIFFKIIGISKQIRKSDKKYEKYNDIELILYALERLEKEVRNERL